MEAEEGVMAAEAAEGGGGGGKGGGGRSSKSQRAWARRLAATLQEGRRDREATRKLEIGRLLGGCNGPLLYVLQPALPVSIELHVEVELGEDLVAAYQIV